MSNVLRLALVDPADSSRELLKATLLGLDTIWLEAECSQYAFFPDVVGQTGPDIALVAIDGNPEAAVKLIDQLTHDHPKVAVLASSSSTDGSLILRVMRAGAKEFLTQPLRPEDVSTAIQRVARQKFGNKPGRGTSGCQVIAVAGATGGVGSTSLAVNLGCVLAADPANSVVLLDLDLALGDADVFLDTIPEYTLTDVSQNIARLDFTLLKRSLTKHASGLYLLPRPVQLEDARYVTTEDLGRVIGLLKATFTHLIIDTSKSFTPVDMYAIEQSSHVLLVTQLDLPCLRNVVRLMMGFKSNEALVNKLRIVVNRVGHGTGDISVRKAQETLGQEIYWQIPNDYRVMIEVRNNGVPLLEQAPKAAITQAIGSLADSLTGKTHSGAEGDSVSKTRSWLNLWPPKSSSKAKADVAAS